MKIKLKKWEKLEKQDYDNLIKNGELLTSDGSGYKVIRLSNGNIAKFFRLKRIFSSALIWPYVKRFIRAVRILKKKNIPTLQILKHYKVPYIKRDILVYKPLEGQSLLLCRSQ